MAAYLLQDPRSDTNFTINQSIYPHQWDLSQVEYLLRRPLLTHTRQKKIQHFLKAQESTHKNVECCFKVFKMIRDLSRQWA